MEKRITMESTIRQRLRSLSVPGTNRLEFLHGLATELGLAVEIQETRIGKRWIKNLVIGEGPYWVSAHWDVVNTKSENANDNGAACIAVLELCSRIRELSGVIFDAEEIGGWGSLLWSWDNPVVRWVINLELAGEGGAHWLVGECDTWIGQQVSEKSSAPRVQVPFNDSVSLRKSGLDACLVQPCPVLKGEPDLSNWKRCHTLKDTVDALPPNDLDLFIDSFERVVSQLV